MSASQPAKPADRAQIIAIRRARRYLKANDGALARVLNAYKAASTGDARLGYLPEQ